MGKMVYKWLILTFFKVIIELNKVKFTRVCFFNSRWSESWVLCQSNPIPSIFVAVYQFLSEYNSSILGNSFPVNLILKSIKESLIYDNISSFTNNRPIYPIFELFKVFHRWSKLGIRRDNCPIKVIFECFKNFGFAQIDMTAFCQNCPIEFVLV